MTKIEPMQGISSGETLGKTLGKAPGKTPGKAPTLILECLLQAPSTSIPELAQQLDKSVSAIERAIRKLRTEGKLMNIVHTEASCGWGNTLKIERLSLNFQGH